MLKKALDSTEGHRAVELIHGYQRTWWAAVAGWGVTVLLALGLVAALLTPRAPAEAEPAPPEPPPAPEPHRIT